MQWIVAISATAILFLVLYWGGRPLHGSENAPINTISLDNQTGVEALVKVVGPWLPNDFFTAFD